MRVLRPPALDETELPDEVQAREHAVAADLIADLYRRSRITILLSIAYWLLLHDVLGFASDDGTAIDWVLDFALALIVLRWGLVMLLPDVGSVRTRSGIFAGATASIGIAFGVLNFMAYSQISAIQIVMLATCQAALTSMALVSMAASAPAYLLFTLPNVGVLVVLAFHSPLPEIGDVFALMLLLYLTCLLIMHWYVHSSLKESFLLRRRLTAMSLHDPLTALWNRRYVTEFMANEAALAARSGRVRFRPGSTASAYRFAVILIDLDHFKAINDGRGHDVGDAVLVQVGRILRDALRAEDVAARWGGEEFVVIARNVDDDAIGLAERIRRTIAAARLDAGSGPPLFVTCSIGYAVFPFSDRNPAASTWEDVLALADRCLYFAKDHGRNRSIGMGPGTAFDSLPDFSALLEAGLEEAGRLGWVRFLEENDGGGGFPEARRPPSARRAASRMESETDAPAPFV